jgi:hypothetical protein
MYVEELQELIPFHLTINSGSPEALISSFAFKSFFLFNEHHGFLPILLTATKSSLTPEQRLPFGPIRFLFISPSSIINSQHRIDFSLFRGSQVLL